MYDSLVKKIEKLNDLMKALKQLNKPTQPDLPKLPAIKAPPQPSMQPGSIKAPKMSSGAGPDSKKDPKKVAEQIKNGSMSTKTQKVMLKFDTNGQWSMRDEPTDPSSV